MRQTKSITNGRLGNNKSDDMESGIQNSAFSVTQEELHEIKSDVTTPSGLPDVNQTSTVDDIQKHLGGYGRYQMLIFVLLSLVYMRGGWHIWISIYQGWDPGYQCNPSPGISLNESVPNEVKDGQLVYSACRQYINLTVSNKTKSCDNGWTYFWESGYTSIVSEYNLVCDDSYLNELTSTIYMVGSAFGVLSLTPLADRFGAKSVMLVCLWVQAVFGTCIIWSMNVIVYCILKFLIGMTNMTVALNVFVLMSETFDAAHRAVPTIAMEFFWALSIMSLALLGYLIPNWKDLELAIALPINVLSVLFIFIIPESLPFLLSKGRVHQAKLIIRKYLKINRLPDIPDLNETLSEFEPNLNANHVVCSTHIQTGEVTNKENPLSESSPSKKMNNSEVYTVFSLFKTPKLRKFTIIMFYLFLVNSLSYFGIMFNTPTLNGDRFLNLFLLGVVEIPAYIVALFSNKIIGRRRSISIFLLICAVANLTVIFIPDQSDGVDLDKLKTALVLIGKFGITGSYSTIYLYAAEVFPTVVRNQAVGASSFFENIGSIAAPNMVYVNNSMNNLPLGIFGGMTVVGCAVVLLLPETQNKPLPQTIDDVEDK
ncbi:hypothetical protein Btru_052141 [Bulinus truncatus]|nr:hypothetical protein Btru_052141 [Bulinus truncatus]